jgi:hypothetical protein
MVVVVQERGIGRHRITVVGRGPLGMETVGLDRRVMETVEERDHREMGTEALVLQGMEGGLLRVGLDHRVTVVERDRPGMGMVAGHRLLLGQHHLRLALHRRRDLLLGPRREVLSRDIRREERSRHNGLSSRRVGGRADLVAITMAQRHGRPAIAVRPVLAVAVVVQRVRREVGQRNENSYA